MSEPSTTSRPKITEAQLIELAQLRTRRLKLQREADVLRKSEDRIAKHVAAELERCDKKTCKRGKLQAFFATVAGRVSWSRVAEEHLGPDKCAELREEAKPSKRLVVEVVAMLLLCCFVLTGCLKEPHDHDHAENDTAPVTLAGSFDEEPAADPAAAPVAAAPVVAAPAPRVPFGMCVVYTNPDFCAPCRFLDQDLKWLTGKYAWTMTDDPAEAADFVIVPRRDQSQTIPFLEFYLDGFKVAEHLGYSCDPDFNVRKKELRQIVDKHPRAKRL